MDSKTFLFGFGVGTVIVSAFLFVIFLADQNSESDPLNNQELVAMADELILEAHSRGIQRDIDISAFQETLSEHSTDVMTEDEIVAAAELLGMSFPQISIIAEVDDPIEATDDPYEADAGLINFSAPELN